MKVISHLQIVYSIYVNKQEKKLKMKTNKEVFDIVTYVHVQIDTNIATKTYIGTRCTIIYEYIYFISYMESKNLKQRIKTI